MPPRVLVTRAARQSSSLAEELQRYGLEPVILPVLEIAPLSSYGALDATLERIGTYDWLIFTSANAIAVFKERFKGSLPASLRVAVIGTATRNAAEEAGLRVSLQPERATGEGLVEALVPHAAGKRFLIVRALVARDVLPDELRSAGAEVDIAEAYKTTIPEDAMERLRSIFNGEDQPKAITFTSSSSANHLIGLLKKTELSLPSETVLASIGPITSATMQSHGLTPTVEAQEATVASLAKAVAEALGYSCEKMSVKL